ncbi:hypothetical protein CHUAL_013034 [Chamberlinius hualienensis]
MLYVFLVEKGTMLSFDMNLALETVKRLKQEIARRHNFPEEKQVLLISGGESLNPSARVCSYSAAGTDTNPIFLLNPVPQMDKDFRKYRVTEFPAPSPVSKEDLDMKEQVEGLVNMPSNYMTVVSRSQLAQQFHDIAKDVIRACEQLIHEQHLQQQGWAAVIANLEDISGSFRQRTEFIDTFFKTYYEKGTQITRLMGSFKRDLELAQKIPVIKTLYANPVFKSVWPHLETIEPDAPLTLLQWINNADMNTKIETLPQTCINGMDLFNKDRHEKVMKEASETVSDRQTAEISEVTGLSDRLYHLDKLMSEARQHLQEQADLAQSFLQNQARAGNLNDPSILPDLCESHRKQLDVMLKNHYHLKDFHRRCINAKRELSENLHYRLYGVTHIEQAMVVVGQKLTIYHQNIKRLKMSLDIFEQIHYAPTVYLLSVAEIIRRKSFTADYLKWAKETALHATSFYEAEVAARNEFMYKIGNHFLKRLFPGLDSQPAGYGLQAPDDFDSDLPQIEMSDIERLRSLLPEFAQYLEPEVMQKLTSSLLPHECHGVRDVFVSAIDGAHSLAVPVVSGSEEVSAVESPSDDKDPESEPDTEEFEKVEQCTVLTDVGVVGELAKGDDMVTKLSRLEGVIADIRQQHKTLCSNFRGDLCDVKNLFKNCEESLTRMTSSFLSEMTGKVKDVVEAKNIEVTQFKRDTLSNVQQMFKEYVESALNFELNAVNQRHSSSLLTMELKLKKLDSMVEMLGKHLAAKAALQSQATLEHEVELVNLKEDHKLVVAGLETRVNELSALLDGKSEQSAQLIDKVLAQAESTLQMGMEEMTRQMESDFLVREQNAVLAKLEEVEVRHESELKKLILDYELKLEQDKTAIEEKYSERISELTNEMTQEKLLALEQLKESMYKAHQIEIETLKVKPSIMDRSPSDSSLEKIERPESTEPLMLEQQIAQLRAELHEKDAVLEAITKKHEEEIKELKEQENAFRIAKLTLTAEKQVWFNETIRRLCADKDQIIRELETQITALKKGSEVSPGKTKEPISPVSPSSQSSDFSQSLLERSASGSLAESVMVTTAIEQSTITLKNEASTSTVPVDDCSDKISFLTCSVGDLVLLTYDHKLENYLMFTMTSTLHFLNTDCWEDFGIKKDSAETKRNWIVGRVIDKEYCQAKKKSNRFNVPLGTKFYRIKVKPFSLDTVSKVGMSSSVYSVKDSCVSHKTSQT